MQDFQQRNKLRKILYSKITVVILLIVAVLLMRGAFTVLKKESESRENVRIVEQKLNIARERDKELSREIYLLETEAGIEREIRNKFSVTKEGEEVAIIIDSSSNTSDLPVKSETTWSLIKTWLKRIF